MKFSGVILCLWISALLLVALPAPAQQPPATQPALRKILDPHSGLRWILVRDAAHPGGPGRLIELQPGAEGKNPAPAALPVIHTGDHVLVEEHTRVADGVLESIALGPAVPGESLRLRLRIGGRIVHAIAVAPGRAALNAAMEVRP